MKLACFYILKKRLNGVLDQNIGLIIQRFLRYSPKICPQSK